MNRGAEHLQATADTQDTSTKSVMAQDAIEPALVAQKLQIGTGRLGAGQDHQVRRRQRVARADELEIDVGLQA